MDWSYTTDPVGNPLTISSSLVPAQSRDYEYEPYSYFLERDQGYWLNTFVYDKIGNRVSEIRGSVGSSFTYLQNPSGGNSPRLASVTNGSSTLTYGYDAAGNTTSIVGTNPPSTSTYIPSYRGELSSIKSSGGGANNSYDGRGFLYRSVGKSTPRFNTDFIYGSDGMLWEYATEDVASRETQVHRIVRFGGRPVAVVRWGEPLEPVQRRFYTTDHLGTPILVTDEAGDEVWSGGFGAFGEDTYFDAFGSDIRLGLPGQFEDPSWAPATTLRYNVHRWYEPGTGRYAKPDPVWDSSNPTIYGYVGGRPTSAIDPLGLIGWRCSVLGGAISGEILGGGYHIGCESDCVDGRKSTTFLLAGGLGLGFGAGADFSRSDLQDGASHIDPTNLEGQFGYAGCSFTPLGGFAVSKLNLGSARGAPGGSPSGGLGVGCSVVSGFAFIVGGSFECCGTPPDEPILRAP